MNLSGETAMSFSHFLKQVPYYCTLTRRLITGRSSRPPHFFPISFGSLGSTLTCPKPISSSAAPSPPSVPFFPVTESYKEPYLSVRLRCPKQLADPFSDALLSFGASSVSFDEEDACDGSNEISVVSTFPVSEEVRASVSLAADSVGLKDIPNYEVEMGTENDWIHKTQESFRPVEVTKGQWIVPEWITPPDIQATNIILNPGLAFGTGDHPTTKLCLLLLRRLIKGNELFLDYGTGSGVLGIAAIKFGARISVGIDIDPEAIMSARRNAILNNIKAEEFQLYRVRDKARSVSKDADNVAIENDEGLCGTEALIENEKFDVVIANILLNPLLEQADHIVSFAKPDATVGLSGILIEQLPFIRERYARLLDDISVSEMDEWACVSGIKKRRVQTEMDD